MAKRDYYEVLGVAKTATGEDIKRAYRRAAIEHHPDKGGDSEKFKEINEAYETLKDPSKRNRYDQFGHVGSSGGFDYSQGFGGFNQGNFDIDLDLGDIFSSFFGGGRTATASRQPRGRDVETSLSIDFNEAIFGVNKNLELNLLDVCSVCKGSRAEPGAKIEACRVCGGSGRVTRSQNTILGSIQQTTTCDNCGGRGEVPTEHCHNCSGVGVVKTSKIIKVELPPGVEDGITIRYRGDGEAAPQGPKGDLYVKLKVRPHSKLARDGHNIVSTQTVDMVTAALGGEVEVETIDGGVKMKVPPGTQAGQSFKLSDHGVPFRGGTRRGAHVVTLNVKIPKKLNSEQKALLKKLGATLDHKAFWKR